MLRILPLAGAAAVGLLSLAVPAQDATAAERDTSGVIEEVIVTAKYPEHLRMEEVIVTAVNESGREPVETAEVPEFFIPELPRLFATPWKQSRSLL